MKKRKQTHRQEVKKLEEIVLGEKARQLPTENNLPTFDELNEDE